MAFPHRERSELTSIGSTPSEGQAPGWRGQPSHRCSQKSWLPCRCPAGRAPPLPWLLPSPAPILRRSRGHQECRGRSCGRLGDAILLTVVGLLKAAFDGDDSLGTGHLQLQVGVVGDGHELYEARLTQESVVDAGEVDHLEGEWLLAEVVWLAEGDAEPDAPKGHGFLP